VDAGHVFDVSVFGNRDDRRLGVPRCRRAFGSDEKLQETTIMADLNPIDVLKALKGAGYPADRDELVSAARKNGADGAFVDRPSGLDQERFDGPNEVQQALFDSP